MLLHCHALSLVICITRVFCDIRNAPAYIFFLQIASGFSSSFPAPPGYTQLEQDLAEGAGSRYIYLYTTKSESLPPIKEIQVMSGPSSNVWPDDPAWVRINSDTNEGAGGDYVYVSYRYN